MSDIRNTRSVKQLVEMSMRLDAVPRVHNLKSLESVYDGMHKCLITSSARKLVERIDFSDMLHVRFVDFIRVGTYGKDQPSYDSFVAEQLGKGYVLCGPEDALFARLKYYRQPVDVVRDEKNIKQTKILSRIIFAMEPIDGNVFEICRVPQAVEGVLPKKYRPAGSRPKRILEDCRLLTARDYEFYAHLEPTMVVAFRKGV